MSYFKIAGIIASEDNSTNDYSSQIEVDDTTYDHVDSFNSIAKKVYIVQCKKNYWY